MEKYTKIVEFLNSSDPETIIIGLQYLKEVNIEIPKKAFKDNKEVNLREACDGIINYIVFNTNDMYWKILLDRLMCKIITYSPIFSTCDFSKYKFKAFVAFNNYN